MASTALLIAAAGAHQWKWEVAAADGVHAAGAAAPTAAPAAGEVPPPPAAAEPSQEIVAVLAIKDDPAFKTYFRMLFAGIPEGGIKQKMEIDGVDPALLNDPNAPSPNQPTS